MTQLPLLPAPVLAWLAAPLGSVAAVAPLAPGVWWWAVAPASWGLATSSPAAWAEVDARAGWRKG